MTPQAQQDMWHKSKKVKLALSCRIRSKRWNTPKAIKLYGCLTKSAYTNDQEMFTCVHQCVTRI